MQKDSKHQKGKITGFFIALSILKKGRVKKRKFFHASFCFWMQQLLYFIKKCITPLTP